MVHAHWHILEDYPTKEDEYLVCFLTYNGEYGWPDVLEFTNRDGWQHIGGQDHDSLPTHWCNLPMPK